MDTSKKITMRVEMEVTVPQALALRAMFEHWSKLGSWGASRTVGFFVDGDGNFQPKATFAFSEDMPELTDEMRGRAMSIPMILSPEERNAYTLRDDLVFDFDSIAYMLRDFEMNVAAKK